MTQELLKEKIEDGRIRLNQEIQNKEDYKKILDTSKELDLLIEQYLVGNY